MELALQGGGPLNRPGRGGTRERRRTEMLERLRGVIRKELSQGITYADLNLDVVLSRAGVPKSTFYRYFTGKSDLLRTWFEQITSDAGAGASWLDITGPATLEDVERKVRERLSAYREDLPEMAAVFETAYYDPELRRAVDDIVQEFNADLAADIRKAQEHGWVDGELPPRETAIWLNWMAIRGANQLLGTDDEERVEALVRAFARLVWSTLFAFTPSVGPLRSQAAR